jgi:hypothetical protein
MRVLGADADNAIAMFPSTLQHSFATRVFKSVGDYEQRWSVRPELFSAILSYHQLNGYDYSLLLTFFQTMRGMYVNPSLTNTFEITLLGVTYQYCTFDQDDLSPSVSSTESFSVDIKIKQLRPN